MSFRVGVTCDLRGDDGRPLLDLGLELLDEGDAIEWSFLPEHEQELRAADVAGFDAVMVWDSAVTESTLSDLDRLMLFARLGVGLNEIDVDACTEAGVLVTTTPDAVRRPVASSVVAFMLAISHRILPLDRVVREGHWYEVVTESGPGLTSRTMGIIGLGNIGREVVRLLRPWEMRVLAYDPYPPAEIPPDVRLTGTLEELLSESDFIVLTCPLTLETHHLLDRDRLAQAKAASYVINVARGPIIDTDALVAALEEGRLAGAALDVLEHEPPPRDHPLLAMDNVILAPHAIAGTDEMNLGIGRSAIASILAVARGEAPENLVNPAALEHSRVCLR